MLGVPALSARDRSRLDAALVDLYTLRDKSALVTHLLATLPVLVDADLFSYIEADPVRGRFAAIRTPTPDSEEMLSIFAPMAGDHPVIRHLAATGSRAAFRVGDFVSNREWRAMPMYTEFMRPERIEHQLGVAAGADDTVMTFVAAHRSGGRDFSQRDTAVMTALAPHVTRAMQNAELLSRIEHGGEVIEAWSNGRLRFTTPTGRRWLGEYFGDGMEHSDRVPEVLLGAPRPGRPVYRVVEKGSRRLLVRRFWRADILTLVLTEDELTVPRLRLEELGLSPREIDVVTWLALGKTNDEIGEILGIAVATVKKHLTQAFEKLGVDGRTAAALRVRELSGARR